MTRPHLRSGRPLLALACVLAPSALTGCVATDAGSEEATGAVLAAIEGGKSINDGSMPLSSTFPLSTVQVGTNCTGTLIAPTKVLTAAHCKVSQGDDVAFYPTTKGAGAKPTGDTIAVATAPNLEPGVSCPGPMVDSSCWSTYGSGVSHLADLAVLTLASQAPAPYVPVPLRPASAIRGALSDSTYAVGQGFINFTSVGCDQSKLTTAVGNANGQMQWLAIPGAWFDPFDATSVKITTHKVVADPGDSGGPLFRKIADSPLMIMGVLSGYDCAAPSNTYSSVLDAGNYQWLVEKGATVASFTRAPGEGESVWPPASESTTTQLGREKEVGATGL